MCKYCEKVSYDHSTYDGSAYIEYEPNLNCGLWITFVDGKYELTFHGDEGVHNITHCPWCGRELGEATTAPVEEDKKLIALASSYSDELSDVCEIVGVCDSLEEFEDSMRYDFDALRGHEVMYYIIIEATPIAKYRHVAKFERITDE